MFSLYQVAFAPAWKPYRIGVLFTDKNGDFGTISVTKRSCAAPIPINGESDIGEVSILYQIPFRVGIRHTGFVQILIQNSRLHLDFSTKNMSLSNSWSTETLKKRRKKAFSMTCRRDWIRFDKHEKKFHLWSTCCSFQKKEDFYHFFKTLPLFSSIFHVWKIAGQI